jgi:RNA polymerase sigma-70 factor (ECF subfamily)
VPIEPDSLAADCRAFQAGDPQALDRVYAACHPPLARFVAVLCRGRDEAADVCQQTWLRAIEKIRSLRSPEKVQAWLFAIAHREFGRRRARARPVGASCGDDAVAADPSAVELVLRGEQQAAASRAVEALSVEHRAVLWLAVVDGLSHGEIGRILGIPEGTARSRLHYALQSLRRQLEEES